MIRPRGELLALLAVAGAALPLLLAGDPEVVVRDRREVVAARRAERADHTMLAFKNHYFRRAIAEDRRSGLRPDMASVARRMSELESDYRLPYRWGGSIKNHLDGLDCTGFVHGIMYYLGLSGGERRFNTRSLYHRLKRDRAWQKVFDASDAPSPPFDPAMLLPGDVILWPSDLSDSRNFPGPIWGHVGIVVGETGALQVTHFVNSDAYNDRDSVGIPGPGINTLPAAEFVALKQRGILTVFRLKGLGPRGAGEG